MPKVTEEYIANKKKEIIDAAYQVCLEKPITDIVLQDITDKTGFSHGVIYRYYKDIDEVLHDLVASINSSYSYDEQWKTILKESKDWQSDSDPSQLWLEASKTMYDPCPPGYKLPTRNKSCIFWSGTSIASDAAYRLNEANGSFSVGSLIFPLTGRISDTDGSLVNDYGIVWSGRWDSGTENGYGFNTSEWRNKGNIRSRGGAVRCVTSN